MMLGDLLQVQRQVAHEPCQDGVIRGGCERPLGKLQGVGVAHSPVGICLWGAVGFDSEEDGDGGVHGRVGGGGFRGGVVCICERVAPGGYITGADPLCGGFEGLGVDVGVLELCKYSADLEEEKSVETKRVGVAECARTMPPIYFETNIRKMSVRSTFAGSSLNVSRKAGSYSFSSCSTP